MANLEWGTGAMEQIRAGGKVNLTHNQTAVDALQFRATTPNLIAGRANAEDR